MRICATRPWVALTWCGLTALLCLMVGCASPELRHREPKPNRSSALAEAPNDSLTGRLSVRVDASPNEASAAPATAFTVLFDITGNAQSGSLALSTPLGTTVAQANWAGDSA